MVKKAFSAVLTVLALICSAFLPSFGAYLFRIFAVVRGTER